jgi:iron complex outermembrane receptor protein
MPNIVPRHAVLLTAVVAGNLLRGTTAGAQGGGTPPTDTAARTLKAVQVTETRTTTTIGGASALILTTDKLRDAPAPILEHVLREIPFVNVRQNSRGEMELSIRGSDSRQAAVMLDGVPLTLGWDHRSDPSLIPMSGSDELVVVRGLGSLLGGPNALGGTITVSQGAAAPAAGTRQTWGGFGLDATTALVASLGTSRTVSVRGGVLTTRAGLGARTRDGVALPRGIDDETSRDGLRTNSDLRQADGFASLRWNGRAGRSLGATVTGFSAERGVPPEEHLQAPRLWRYPYTRRVVAAINGNAGAFETPLGFATLEASLGYNGGSQKIESFTDRTYATPAATELGDERTWTLRTVASHTLPRGAKASAAYTRADIHYDETLPPTALARYRQVLWSAATELELPLGARSHFGTGLVFDKSTSPETGGRTPGQPPLDNVGWRAGLQHEFSNALKGHASANRRSRFPALRELYSGSLNRFLPNPTLRPETLLGAETGLTWHGTRGAARDATVQVTAFRHRLEDAVVRITLTNPTRFMRVNRDRIESDGLELVTGVSFGDAADRAVALTADATLQRIRLVDATAGGAERHPENNPETRASATLSAPLVRGARLLANGRYAGRQYCLHGETGAEVTIGAQGAADVGVERHFMFRARGPFSALRALLSLDNVGNAAVYDQCGLPQPGRTLRMMVSFR